MGLESMRTTAPEPAMEENFVFAPPQGYGCFHAQQSRALAGRGLKLLALRESDGHRHLGRVERVDRLGRLRRRRMRDDLPELAHGLVQVLHQSLRMRTGGE